jgi:hypothetical protein
VKRLISSWQGLVAGAVALALYLALPIFLRAYDPEAGLFDAGYLQWVGLATVLAFWTVFVGWVAFQIAFPSLDKDADKKIGEWFEALSPREKWYSTQALFLLMLVLFFSCLAIVPL